MGEKLAEAKLHKQVIEEILSRADRQISEVEIQKKYRGEYDEIVIENTLNSLVDKDKNIKVEYKDIRLVKVYSVKIPGESYIGLMRGIYNNIVKVKRKKKYISIQELYNDSKLEEIKEGLREVYNNKFTIKEFISFIDQMKYWYDISIIKYQGELSVYQTDKYALSYAVMTEEEEEEYQRRQELEAEEEIAGITGSTIEEDIVETIREEGEESMIVGREVGESAKEKLNKSLNEWLRTTTLAEMDDEVYEISKEVKGIIKRLNSGAKK